MISNILIFDNDYYFFDNPSALKGTKL